MNTLVDAMHTRLRSLIEHSLGDYLDQPGGLVYSDSSTLCPGKVYIVGLNPGGDPSVDTFSIRDSLAKLSTQVGNDYTDAWAGRPAGAAPLQRRIRYLIEAVLEARLEDTFATNLIFRKTPSARSLDLAAEGNRCWPVHEAFLDIVRPDIILAFGNSGVSPYGYLLGRCALSGPQLQSTLTYNANGTVATIKDGKNNVTTLSVWKRGIAQVISYADQSTQTASVDDYGWITSVVDQLGSTTSFEYDLMGRLTKIIYPAADSTAWSNSTFTFDPMMVAEYGIPSGHWKRKATTGNGVTSTFYDALWQPVLVLTEDVGSALTKSYVVKRYDIHGRLVFTSYAVASLSSVSDTLTGVTTVYDVLGRVSQVRQDSEIGVLTTTTEYLPNFKIRTTNPRGYQTTTSYRVYDAPDTSQPLLIQAPEGVTTTIARDVFGKATEVTRAGG